MLLKIYLFVIFIFSVAAIGDLSFNDSVKMNSAILFSDSLQSQLPDSLKLIEGKKLYRQKCRNCHALYNPKDYKLSLWKENLDEMKYKAELKDDEYELIYLYLKTYCKK